MLTIFAIMLSDFFDTMGTVTGIAAEAGLAGEDGSVPGIRNVLIVDSLAAVAGGWGGTSSNTTFIESAAGVAEGGRTGFASVVTGVLFLLAVFLAPVAQIIPPQATAPALVLVGYLMFTLVKDIPVADFEDGLPALLTMILMPLTYDITVGIGAGFITWVLLKVVNRKFSEIHWLMWVTSIGFVDLLRQRLDPVAHQVVRVGRGLTPGALDRPPTRRPSRQRDRAGGLRAGAAVPVPSPRCSNARRCPTGLASSAPASPVRARSPSRPTSWPARASRPPTRSASPTSWSTSRSRGPRRSRSTRAISEAIEGVGGSFNAATDRESTVYWVRVPAREARRAADVVGELIVRPRLEDAEIDHERSVIVEEIRSYLDDPAEYAQILIQQAMFGDGAARSRDLRRRGRDPGAPGSDDPRLLVGRLPTVERGRGHRRRSRPRRGHRPGRRPPSAPATG